MMRKSYKRYLYSEVPMPRRTSYRRRKEGEDYELVSALEVPHQGGGRAYSESGPSSNTTDSDEEVSRFRNHTPIPTGQPTTLPQTDVDHSFVNDGDDSSCSGDFSLAEEHSPSPCETFNSIPSPCQVQPEVGGSSDRSPLFDTVLCKCTSSTSGDAFLMCLALGLRHNLSWVALVDILKMVNVLFGKPLVPATKYFFLKYFEMGKEETHFHFYCPSCEAYLGRRSNKTAESQIQCVCGEVIDTRKVPSYFLSVGLKTQLEDQLKNEKFVKMLNYRFERQKECDNALEDIYDGAGYRKYSDPGQILSFPHNFSYTFNTDGIPMGKSSKKSIWPIYVQINELPPKERSKHMLLAGIWVGNKDPNMSIFLKPFVEEANVLATEGVTWKLNDEVVISKVIPLCVSVDSVARSRILNMSQFNGYYGCTVCYHKGEYTEKGMRYPLSPTRYPDRTHKEIVQGMIAAFGKRHEKNHKKRIVKGVKGPTPLMLMKHLDLCASFPPDYMHLVLLGVVRKHIDLLVSSASKKYYIGGEDKIAVIDNCLQSIHPPQSVTRTPRGLKDMSLWKASEWRSFIVFYCIVCLGGVLKNKYLAHLGMLSTAMYLLLQKSVSPEDVVTAHDLITKYVFLFQEFFGKEHMVYNVHLLTHLTKGILNWVPLWAVNTFPFEDQNRYLLQLQRSPAQVASEVVRKFLTFNAFPKLCEKYLPSESVLEFSEEMTGKKLKFVMNVGETVLVGRGTPHSLSTEELDCLANSGLFLHNCKVYHKFIDNGIRYCTAEYAKGLKTDDSFLFAHERYLHILKIVSGEDESVTRVLVFVKEVNVDATPVLSSEHVEINHVKRIAGYGELRVLTPGEISCQCIHMNVNGNEFVCQMPFGCYGD